MSIEEDGTEIERDAWAELQRLDDEREHYFSLHLHGHFECGVGVLPSHRDALSNSPVEERYARNETPRRYSKRDI